MSERGLRLWQLSPDPFRIRLNRGQVCGKLIERLVDCDISGLKLVQNFSKDLLEGWPEFRIDWSRQSQVLPMSPPVQRRRFAPCQRHPGLCHRAVEWDLKPFQYRSHFLLVPVGLRFA